MADAEWKLKTGPGGVVFEFSADGLFVYSGCCGVRLDRRKAKRLKRLLKRWLATGKDERPSRP